MPFPGVSLTIDNEEFVVPALSLGQLRNGGLDALKAHDEKLATGASFFEMAEVRGKIILLALQRNYPDFAEDKLFSFLDLNNIAPFWSAVLGLSGFTSGEATAAKAPSGTSNPSTAA